MIAHTSRAQRELREMREAKEAERQQREGVAEQIRFNTFSNKAAKIVAGRERLKSAGMMVPAGRRWPRAPTRPASRCRA
jgi:hypothetical protein